jgi:hypothetical protein
MSAEFCRELESKEWVAEDNVKGHSQQSSCLAGHPPEKQPGNTGLSRTCRYKQKKAGDTCAKKRHCVVLT